VASGVSRGSVDGRDGAGVGSVAEPDSDDGDRGSDSDGYGPDRDPVGREFAEDAAGGEPVGEGGVGEGGAGEGGAREGRAAEGPAGEGSAGSRDPDAERSRGV